MTVMVWDKVLYACHLNATEEENVKEYASLHPEMELKEVIQDLWFKGEIDLYGDATERDFETDYIENVEMD